MVRAKVPGYPSLKAKAAQTRHLVPFCAVLAQRHKFGLGRAPMTFRKAEWAPHSAAYRDLI
eukprot:1825706-Alexandrium_andersonii.AAC.1